MKKFAVLLSLLLVFSVVLAACGDAENSAAEKEQNSEDNVASADVNPDVSGDKDNSKSQSNKSDSNKDKTKNSAKSNEPPATDVYGTWKCTAVDLMGDGEMMSAKEFKQAYDGADLGKMYVLEFDKKGNARLTTTIGEETGTGIFTYKESDGVYTLIETGVEDVDGYDQAVTAEIHGKDLILVISGRVKDEEGNQMVVKLAWQFEKTSKNTSL